MQTLELFTHIIARSGGVKAVVEKDILCAFEVYDSGGWCHVEYAFVTAASAQSGVHKPQQVFVCLEVVDKTEHRFLGKVLKFSRLAYIEPEGSSYLPHRLDKAGRIRMYTADRFASRLLGLPVLADETTDAVQVVVHFLEFQDLSLDCVTCH